LQWGSKAFYVAGESKGRGYKLFFAVYGSRKMAKMPGSSNKQLFDLCAASQLANM